MIEDKKCPLSSTLCFLSSMIVNLTQSNPISGLIRTLKLSEILPKEMFDLNLKKIGQSCDHFGARIYLYDIQSFKSLHRNCSWEQDRRCSCAHFMFSGLGFYLYFYRTSSLFQWLFCTNTRLTKLTKLSIHYFIIWLPTLFRNGVSVATTA